MDSTAEPTEALVAPEPSRIFTKLDIPTVVLFDTNPSISPVFILLTINRPNT